MEDGPIAPFLVDPSESQIIDRVQGNLATLESGEVVPVREIYNPDGINLEGALFEGGRAHPVDKTAIRERLEKIRNKQPGEGTVLKNH